MNINDKLAIWKRKVIELEKEIDLLDKDRNILVNLSSEIKAKQNLKLADLLEGISLEEEASYLKDWIDFHRKEFSKYKIKIENLEEAREQEGLEETKREVKLLFEGKAEKKTRFFAKPVKNYAMAFVILMIIATSIFFLKPAITGQVVLGKETTYTDNLNLVMNESRTYEWAVKNHGDIKSIKATGNVAGNGTVRIYIEKDGKRYLVYDNKKT